MLGQVPRQAVAGAVPGSPVLAPMPAAGALPGWGPLGTHAEAGGQVSPWGEGRSLKAGLPLGRGVGGWLQEGKEGQIYKKNT